VAVDMNVVPVDGASHDIDSAKLTFEIAYRAALLKALRMTSLVLFAPIMKVESWRSDHRGPQIAEWTRQRPHVP
jgi:translation elongation factor EF-G